MVKHIQDTAPYQNPDNIWVKESRRDLGKMEKLFKQRRHREMEPYVELLLVKVGSIMRQLLSGHRLAIH